MFFRLLTLFFCILTLDKVSAQSHCETISAPLFRYPTFGELDPVGAAITGSKSDILCKFLIELKNVCFLHTKIQSLLQSFVKLEIFCNVKYNT